MLAVLTVLAAFLAGSATGRSIVRNDAQAAANATVPGKVAAAVKLRQDALDQGEADLKSRVAVVAGRETTVGQAEAKMTSREQAADRRDADLTRRESAVVPKEIAAAKNTFGDGTWQVGRDINPGTYRRTGSSSCYWARLSNLSGDLDGILANDNTNGPAVVTILPSDVGFTSKRCGTWTKSN
ncbi:hypothetical protein V7968_25715 [Nocardia vulneris]|uniref:hypothetical protein n=1 Tax=Nocardia vulneris TaxID=1141657 RepID=UPI0030D0EFDC